ncbi:MAG: MFS transporter [Bacteroidetes bacterium]|nr:MAG: MFS transporter [Bacteroidota bacterium]
MITIQKKLTNLFYVVLGLPSTAMGFALSIQIMVLSWILHTKYNLEIDQIGIVWAAGPIAGILAQPIIGLISDKAWFWGGRRRPFIIIGGIFAAMMIFALPNLGRINSFFGIGSLMAVAITVALTLDLAINISFNPTRSIIADVTPAGTQRTKGYTWMQSISNLFGSGAYLMGTLINNYFLIYAGVFIVFLFSIGPLFFITESRELKRDLDAAGDEIQATKTKWGELFKLYFAHGFSWLGIQTMFVYSFAFLEQKMTPLSHLAKPERDALLGQIIGWSFFILNAVGSIWPVFLLGPLSKRIGRVHTHILMVALMSAGYFGIVFFARNTWSLYAMMMILTFGWAAVVSLPFAIMSEKVDKARMGFFMGIFNLSVVLPQLVSSLLLGRVIKLIPDKSLIFIISGFSLAISAMLWLLVKDESRKKL